ncbi:MAG: tripartite tricarboxylate transporter substrate-binding protein, partial [Planctomycetota bacterium]
GRTGAVIVVHEDSPHQSLQDLMQAAADRPNAVTFAANLGAPSHFVGLLLEQSHGTAKFRFAQVGGGADRFAALKGKHATATTLSLEEYLRFQPEGIRALAFLGEKRHEQIPHVATAMEQGLPVDHTVIQYWWMPKGTPTDRCDHFASILKRAIDSPRFQEQLAELKIDPVFLDGQELATHLTETEAALTRVDPGVDSPLPNIPLILAIAAGLLGVAMLTTRFHTAAVSQQKDPSQEVGHANSGRLVLICIVLLALYAAGTIQWGLPLGIMTTLFVGTLGLSLAWHDKMMYRPLVSATIAGTALGLGVLFHLVFTQVFEIGL